MFSRGFNRALPQQATAYLVSIVITMAGSHCAGQGPLPFGTPKGKSPLRGFGRPVGEESLRRQFPKLAAAVTQGDRENANREIQKTDGNGDGIVTEAEWVASGFQ